MLNPNTFSCDELSQPAQATGKDDIGSEMSCSAPFENCLSFGLDEGEDNVRNGIAALSQVPEVSLSVALQVSNVLGG